MYKHKHNWHSKLYKHDYILFISSEDETDSFKLLQI